MGGAMSIVRDVVSNGETGREQSKILDLYMEIGQGKVELMRKNLEDNLRTSSASKNNEFPVSYILDNTSEVFVTMSAGCAGAIKKQYDEEREDDEKIGEDKYALHRLEHERLMKDDTGDLVTRIAGKASDGIGPMVQEMLKLGLNALVSNTNSAGQEYFKHKVIFSNGALIRIDVAGYSKKIEISGLVDTCQKMIVGVFYKSLVDPKFVDPIVVAHLMAESGVTLGKNLETLEDGFKYVMKIHEFTNAYGIKGHGHHRAIAPDQHDEKGVELNGAHHDDEFDAHH